MYIYIYIYIHIYTYIYGICIYVPLKRTDASDKLYAGININILINTQMAVHI
jgi:hypothetical protein